MRTLAAILLLCSSLFAGDRVPFRVTACRPVFVPNVCLPECKPVCVTIDGIDWDLDKIRAEYKRAWTWPGMTEQSLRQHIANEHHIAHIDRLTFDDLRKIHAVIHDREQAKTKTSAPPPATTSRCPGGVCPSTQPQFGTRSRWLFRW